MYKGFQIRYMLVDHIPIMYLTYTLSCTSEPFIKMTSFFKKKVYVGVYDRYMLGTCLGNIYPASNTDVQGVSEDLRYMLA